MRFVAHQRDLASETATAQAQGDRRPGLTRADDYDPVNAFVHSGSGWLIQNVQTIQTDCPVCFYCCSVVSVLSTSVNVYRFRIAASRRVNDRCLERPQSWPLPTGR